MQINEMKTSQIKGLHKMSVDERQKIVKNFAELTEKDLQLMNNADALSMNEANQMVENVIGRMQIPIGVVANLIVNGKGYLVPMATEEPSVIAAANNAAKLVKGGGGVFASNTGPYMIAQMQIINVKNPQYTRTLLMENKDKILAFANEQDPVLVSLGGGAKDLEVSIFNSRFGEMMVAHLIVNVKDAMGANAVNSMAESLSPMIESITAGKVQLKILSNLADKRIVRARALVCKEDLGGEAIVDSITYASEFANIDPYRAATHNKGIMNGITAVVLATGNDTRAVEAGAHSYASRSGSYMPLTKWEKTAGGDLAGSIEIPIAVGLVGGATVTHSTAKLAVKILGVQTANELAEIIASVGLIQNLAAIRALATEGIQKGHMALHARNIAINAGAKGEAIDKVVSKMIDLKKIRVDIAKQILKEIE